MLMILSIPLLLQAKNLVFMVWEVKLYFEFNAERSIDGERLNPFERKMSDSEFQYEPCHFILLKNTLEDLCLRFGYEKGKNGIIECFNFWIKAQVQDLEITNYSKDNMLKILEDFSLVNPSWQNNIFFYIYAPFHFNQRDGISFSTYRLPIPLK